MGNGHTFTSLYCIQELQRAMQDGWPQTESVTVRDSRVSRHPRRRAVTRSGLGPMRMTRPRTPSPRAGAGGAGWGAFWFIGRARHGIYRAAQPRRRGWGRGGCRAYTARLHCAACRVIQDQRAQSYVAAHVCSFASASFIVELVRRRCCAKRPKRCTRGQAREGALQLTATAMAAPAVGAGGLDTQ